MKRGIFPILLILVIAALLFPGITGTTARAAMVSNATMAMVTFRLQVTGDVPQQMTFWMAYGPLAGHFDIIRLHRAGTGVYAASVRLPGGRSSFAFVAGHGEMRARSGRAPGNPVITIQCIDRINARQAASRTAYWHVPLG